MARSHGGVVESPFSLAWDFYLGRQHLDWGVFLRDASRPGFEGPIARDMAPRGADLIAAASPLQAAVPFHIEAADLDFARGEAAASGNGLPAATPSTDEHEPRPILSDQEKTEFLAIVQEAAPGMFAMLNDAVAVSFPGLGSSRQGVSPFLLEVLAVSPASESGPPPIAPPIDLFG